MSVDQNKVDPLQIESIVRSVRDEKSFIQDLLIDGLHWEIPPEAVDMGAIAYDWTPQELQIEGLEGQLADGVIKQIVLPNNPWGVFILEFNNPDLFATGRGMTGPLRRLLRALVPKKRGSCPDQPGFKQENLLFICNHNYKQFRFAHFKAPLDTGKAAPLAAFGWGPDDPVRTVCEFNLRALVWPETTPQDDAGWIECWEAAFDVEKVTKKFYIDYAETFDAFERYIDGRPDTGGLTGDDLRLWCQTVFNRLMFLRFIERKGWLDIDNIQGTNYLAALYTAGGMGDESFYRSRLRPLFFKGLAVEGEQESDAFGKVPFLNGGLFDENDSDERVTDIPDDAFRGIIGDERAGGLFYRYNFTIEESTPLDIEVAVDPEMLGKVFERLVIRRQESGSYYTPRPVVSFMCREALKGYLGGYRKLVDHHDPEGISVRDAKALLRKLADITICDPACGSGAYLVGMLHELHALTQILDTRADEDTARDDYQRKLNIISRNLYGVDIDSFAVNIAQLRLWLTLAVEFDGDVPEPLPNLDFKIEVGDSLTGPCRAIAEDIGANILRNRAATLAELKNRFLTAHGEEKSSLRESIDQEEYSLAEEMDAHYGEGAVDWHTRFVEVFSEGGFDIAIANPPYGIKCPDPLRFQYFPRVTDPEVLPLQSKESYGLFMARGLELLKPGGWFTYIVSDTWRTIKSHWRLRRHLLMHSAVSHILDLPPWIFDATVNTGIITLQKMEETVIPDDHQLIAGDLRPIPSGDWNRLVGNLASVSAHGPEGQSTEWARYTYPQSLIRSYSNYSFFIASPHLYGVMSDARFVYLGDRAAVRVGLQTGYNQSFLRKGKGARGSYRILDERRLLKEEEIAHLAEHEKRDGVDPVNRGGRHFVPYDKGGASDASEGWLPNYWVPTEYFIDWSRDSVHRLRTATMADIKRDRGRGHLVCANDETQIASRFQNSEYYFREGITFSYTGYYAPCFRLNSRGIFDVGGSSCFDLDINIYLALGVLASRFQRYVAKTYIDHTVNFQVDEFKELLLPRDGNGSEAREIISHIESVIAKQKEEEYYPYHLHEQKLVDALVYKLFGLTEEDIREINLWYCRRYLTLARAQGVLDDVQEKYASHLTRCDRILSLPPEHWLEHPILALIAAGESTTVELKETLEADNQTGDKHPGVLQSTLKTIAAFLNTEGGTLLIGVADDGAIKGLALDYNLCRKKDADGLELKIRDLLKTRYNPSPLGRVDIVIETLSEGEVCQITVSPATEVVHLGDAVFVRDGNRTLELKGPELTRWLEQRLKTT